MVELKSIEIKIPNGLNMILGQSHFIKTVEDIYETLIESSISIKFGVAFCEASGPCLIRFTGNDETLEALAKEISKKISAGHSFVIFLEKSFPIGVLKRIQAVSEVVSTFCATSNPIQVIIAQTDQGRGILGVIDGFSPKGIENQEQIQERRNFLRKIGYKK